MLRPKATFRCSATILLEARPKSVFSSCINDLQEIETLRCLRSFHQREDSLTHNVVFSLSIPVLLNAETTDTSVLPLYHHSRLRPNYVLGLPPCAVQPWETRFLSYNDCSGAGVWEQILCSGFHQCAGGGWDQNLHSDHLLELYRMLEQKLSPVHPSENCRKMGTNIFSPSVTALQ